MVNWKLRITNVMTNEKKVIAVVPSSTFICDVSTWEEGIYAVLCEDEENTVTKKIVITK